MTKAIPSGVKRYIAGAVLLLGVGLVGWIFAKDKFLSKSQWSGKFLPNAEGQLERIIDPQFKGVTLIHFWANWCEPCARELPELIAFVQKNASVGIRLIGVSWDDHFEDALKLFPRSVMGSSIRLVRDIDGALGNKMGTFQLPETYVVVGENTFTKWVGPQSWSDPRIAEYLKSLAR